MKGGDPAAYFDRINTHHQYKRMSILLPHHGGGAAESPSLFEKKQQLRLYRRYVELAVIRAPETPGPFIDYPAGGLESLREMSAAQGSILEIRHLLDNLQPVEGLDRADRVLHVHFPQLVCTSVYTASIFLGVMSLMTGCEVVEGTIALGELNGDGVLLPLPFPTETFATAVQASKSLGIAVCRRLLVNSTSGKEILAKMGIETKEDSGDDKGKQLRRVVEGIDVILVNNVGALLSEGLVGGSTLAGGSRSGGRHKGALPSRHPGAAGGSTASKEQEDHISLDAAVWSPFKGKRRRQDDDDDDEEAVIDLDVGGSEEEPDDDEEEDEEGSKKRRRMMTTMMTR